MKKTKKINLFIGLLLISSPFLFFNCQNEIFEKESTELVNLRTRILDQKTNLDDFILPIGTSINQISEGQINIKLPNNYVFLLFDEETGVSYSNKSSYSCTCSEQNSCKVIYTTGEGYGCMQNSCSGSCTGTPSGGENDKQVYGVLNTKDNDILPNNFSDFGSLTKEGYQIFFNYVARDKLSEFFNFVYKPTNYKNSLDFIANEGEENTTKVMLQYKGISFAAVVPNYDKYEDSQIINFEKGPTVTCAGNNSCSCTVDKTCIFGNCVYFCDGCTTCTMSVDDK